MLNTWALRQVWPGSIGMLMLRIATCDAVIYGNPASAISGCNAGYASICLVSSTITVLAGLSVKIASMATEMRNELSVEY
jgi:hypothetical protein